MNFSFVAITNDQGIGEIYVIGSMDVKALYPSIDIEHAIDVVCEVFQTMKIRANEID